MAGPAVASMEASEPRGTVVTILVAHGELLDGLGIAPIGHVGLGEDIEGAAKLGELIDVARSPRRSRGRRRCCRP